MAVLFNTPHDITYKLCKQYLPNCFRVIYEEGEIQRKPSPDGIRRVMKECKTKKEHTVLIGDTLVDLQTAQNANIPMIGVTWGCMSKEEGEQVRLYMHSRWGRQRGQKR